MLTALVLICSVAVTPDLGECTRNSATAVMRVPAEFGNPSTCFMHAQTYLAQTSFGQDLERSGQDHPRATRYFNTESMTNGELLNVCCGCAP